MATEVGSLQASLSLDISNFSRGMQAAIAMVQQLGRQLQSALGNTQSFSALQRSAADLKAEIEAIVAALQNMQSTMNNSQSAASIFASIKQQTSGLSGEFEQLQNLLQEIISLLQQINSAVNSTASNTSQMASSMNRFTSATQNANRQTRQTSSNSRQTTTALRNASTQADRLASNLQKGAGFAANLKHIVEGIVISQAFYKMLNIMQDLVSESYQFMNNMAQTEIAFKYLLGNEEDAKSMLESLQDLSITSPISTADATEMSRKLMAMGFSAKSVIPTLKILTDTAAVFTNEAGEMNDMMAHVVVALGQMKSAGTVSMQELRQLYNAGIPIFQILQDGLGLTADQVRNIGKLGVDSGTAILAILNELQKKYTGAAEEMTRTIPGALEVIQDGLYVINSILFSAPFQWVTEKLNNIADRVSAIVKIARVYGAGGIFQAMFPREWQLALRNVIGTFQELGKALTYIGKTVAIVFKSAMGIVLNIAAVVGPPLSVLIHTLSQVAYWVMVNVPLVRRLLSILLAYVMLTTTVKVIIMIAKAIKLLAIAQAVAAMVVNLCKALRSLWAFSKVGFILMMIAGAFLAVALSSEKAKNAIMSFFGKIQNASKDFSDKLNIGFDPNKIAQPEFKPPTDNKQFEDTSDGLKDIADGYDDIANSADNATKKQKKNQSFLQSFDEVYQIKPNSDSNSDKDDPTGGMNDKIKDLMSSLGDLNDTMKDMDWTGDFWQDWGSISAGLDNMTSDALDVGSMAADFWKELVDAFKAPEWAGAGLGAIIGGLLGSLVGHPLIGAAIGALCGWIAGLFWDDFKAAFNVSDISPIVAAIAAVIGMIFSKLLGFGPLQTILASLGLALGSMAVSMICGKIAEAFNLSDADKNSSAIGQALGTIIGGAIGMTLGHPFIGAAIGNLVGGISGLFWNGLADKMGITDVGKIAIPIATTLGSVLGLVVGHPLIGAGIGILVGWLIDSITSGLEAGDWSGVAMPIGIGLGAAIGGFVGGPIGAVAGAAIGALAGWVVDAIIDAFNGREVDLKAIAIPLNAGILAAIGFVAGGPAGALIVGAIGVLVGWVETKIIEGFETGDFNWPAISMPIGGGIGAAIGMIAGGPAGALIGAAIGTLVGWISSKFLEADWSKVGEAFKRPFQIFAGSVGELWSSIWEPIKEAFDNGDWAGLGFNIILGIIKGILAGVATIVGAVVAFFQAVWGTFCEIFGIHSPAETMVPIGLNIILGVLKGFKDASVGVFSWIKDTGLELISNFGEWFIGIKDKIGAWASDTFSSIGDWAGNTATTIGTWASNTAGSFVDWVANTSSSIGGWIADKASAFAGWASETGSSIGAWATDTLGSILGWASETGTSFSDWIMNNSLAEWATNSAQTISDWVTNTAASVGEWATNTGTNIQTWATNITTAVSNWTTNAATSISTWATNAGTSISTWATNARTAISTWTSGTISSVASWASGTANSIGTWATNTSNKISNWVSTKQTQIAGWATNTSTRLSNWASNTSTRISTWASNTSTRFGNWASNTSTRISTWASNTMSRISNWASNTSSRISSWGSNTSSRISSAVSSASSAVSSGFSSMGSAISSWAMSALNSVTSFCSGIVSSLSSAVSSAISLVSRLFSAMRSASSARVSVPRASFSYNRMAAPTPTRMAMPAAAAPIMTMAAADAIPTTRVLSRATPMAGIAGDRAVGDGGASGLVGTSTGTQEPPKRSMFTSENDATAFASKIGKEIVSNLAPLLANNDNNGNTEDKRPIYVGTLIADDRGLKELERKLKVIRVQEDRRGG